MPLLAMIARIIESSSLEEEDQIKYAIIQLMCLIGKLKHGVNSPISVYYIFI